MNNPEFVEVEKIKQLKAQYVRFLDTKQWQQWRHLFCDNFTGVFGKSDAEKFSSADALVNSLSDMLAEAVTVHLVHSPEINFIDNDHAQGIWAMEDIIEHETFKLHGYGYYFDHYERIDNQWKILSIEIKRLKVDFL